MLAHDEPNCRIVKFTLDAGQQVAVHTSTSTVVVTVEGGSGTLIGGDSQMQVAPGDTVVYAPNEPHGMAHQIALQPDTLYYLIEKVKE